MSGCGRKTIDRRGGLTLVELLVVISILAIVTAATVPILAPAAPGRRQREAARLVATILANAQTRAITSGRSAGVWIERLTDDATDGRSQGGVTLFACEMPPPYGGESSGARVVVSQGAAPPSPPPDHASYHWFDLNDSFTTNFSDGLVRKFDLIQFNYQGHIYQIFDGPDTNSDGFIDSLTSVKLRLSIASVLNSPYWPLQPGGAPVPYQILRQPVKSANTPVTLPSGSAIDLYWSGVGTNWGGEVVSTSPFAERWDRSAPLIITFSPRGTLESVYSQNGTPTAVASPLHLLIGKVERLTAQNPPVLGTTDEDAVNIQDTENLWVSVINTTGMTNTSDIGSIDNPADPAATWVAEARRFATLARTTGGR